MKLKNEYRIVTDSWLGYEVQIRRWWFPLWLEIDTNTHPSIERAERFAERHAKEKGSTKYLGKLPKE